ncbi:MAG: hypothetical protein JST68_00310 [Bacteroidetes bacterium]|nr:hypothetical protein [Bacteroidota bacterium]
MNLRSEAGGRPDILVLVLALAALFIPVAFIENSIIHRTGGTFMYPLDDVYIHMSLARNLAFYGTWGMDRFEFASASSSLLYTLLLAGTFKLFSVKVTIPFIINCLAAAGLIIVLQRWLSKQGVGRFGQLLILLAVIVLTPLPIMVVSGMEHTLQCLFFFLFLEGVSEWLERGEGKLLPWPVMLYAMGCCFIRYEGLFPVGIVGLILLFRRKLGAAVVMGIVAVLPLFAFGLYSIAKGSYFLPNSVLLKSDGMKAGIASYLENILVQKLTVVKTDGLAKGTPRPGISLLVTQRLLVILPLMAFVFRGRYKYWMIVLTGTVVMQLCFASTGWLYRYEAYLIFAAVLLLGVMVAKYGAAVWASYGSGKAAFGLLVAFALFFPFLLRISAAYTKTSTAAVNINQQQYQMGTFLGKYYDSVGVAVNDIGVVSWFSKAHNIDLWGLGSMPVARSRKMGYWTPEFLDSLSRKSGVKVAVVFDSWFDEALLGKWTRVGNWKIPDNVICGDDNVTFYALDAADAPELRDKLKAFGGQLPAGVTATYY